MSMIVKNKNLFLFLLFLLLSFLFNLFCLNSLSVLTEHEGYDSCVFKQMGLALVQGKELYKDLFDHKGPIIFYINALAIYLNVGRWGLFLLHVLNYTAVFYLWYKICLLFGCKYKSSFLVIVSGLMLYVTLSTIEGNRIEDWIMFPLSYGVYVGLKDVFGKSTNNFDYLMLGIFSGVIIFMRANSGVILFCTFVLLIYQSFICQNVGRIIKIIFYAFVGFLLVTLSIFLHFYISWGWQGIDNLIFGTFLFNFSVFNNVLEINGWYTYLLHLCFFVISSVLCLYKKTLSPTVFIYLIGCVILTYFLVGRAKFDYYLIIIIPLYIPVLASIFSSKRYYLLLIFLILLLAKQKIIRENISNTVMERERYQKEFRLVDRIMDQIPQEDRTSIWNYNANVDGLQILQRKGITQCNMVLWNHQLGYSDRLRNEIKGKLENHPPQWIIVEKEKPYINKADSLFIHNNYQIADSTYFTNRAASNKKIVFYFFKKNDDKNFQITR